MPRKQFKPKPGDPDKLDKEKKLPGDKDKGFKYGSKEKKKFQEFPRRNDPAFYTKYKTLSESTGKLAFFHRNGGKLNLTINSTKRFDHNIDPILIIDYIPYTGHSATLDSAINTAALSAYKVLNRKYRGSPTSRYESADLGIAQFAIVDFFLSLAQAERAYGLAQVAKVNQRQIPRELLFALGYDADEMMRNLADFRASLNALIVRAQSLCLIKGYSLLDHHLFLLSNVFRDKDTDRGQYFAYRKNGYWLWDPESFATGSALKWVPNSVTLSDMRLYDAANANNAKKYGLDHTTTIVSRLEDQLNALLLDSDIDAICADILAYFGNENDNPNIVRLSGLPEEYKVEAIYDKNVMYQLHNTTVPVHIPQYQNSNGIFTIGNELYSPIRASVIPTGKTIADFQGIYIYQDNNIILSQLCSPGTGTPSDISFGGTYFKVTPSVNNFKEMEGAIIDGDVLAPTPDEIFEWTRNTVLSNKLSLTNDAQTYYYCHMIDIVGSVVPICFTTFLFKNVGFNTRDSSGAEIQYTKNDANFVTTGSITQTIDYMVSLSKYDWAPLLYVNGPEVLGDLDNYIGISSETLKPIHSVAVLSEFHNPVAEVILKDS